MIDTHTHLYLEEFDADRNEAVQRAIESGKILISVQIKAFRFL